MACKLCTLEASRATTEDAPCEGCRDQARRLGITTYQLAAMANQTGINWRHDPLLKRAIEVGLLEEASEADIDEWNAWMRSEERRASLALDPAKV